MNNSPIFYSSLFSSNESNINVDMWDKCLDCFDNGQYLESFHLLLDYINTSIRPKYGNADCTEFHIPHGSVVVNIVIKDDVCTISAPFLEVNPETIVPLLRQICLLNFNNMELSQIYLSDNKLNLNYSCKLSELHPYKMYYVFKEICLTSDRYDDEYVNKFAAKRLYEPIITPFSKEQAEKVYTVTQTLITDAFKYIEYLEGKRWYNRAWDITAITLRQIDFYARPQGLLHNDLSDAIANMYGNNVPIHQLLEAGKQFMNKLQTMDKQDFINDLYEIETFIPNKVVSSLQSLQKSFEREFNNTKENMAAGNFLTVTLGILFVYYNAFYYNNIHDDINKVMINAISASSGKEWDVSAKILSESLYKIMNGDLGEKKKGFFSRLLNK
jgi:hypothetical protein